MLNPTCCVKLIIIKISDEDFRAGSTWVRGPESIWYAWLALTPITISKMFYLSQVLGRRPALKIHGLRTAFIISAAGRTFLRPWEYLRQVEQRSAADYLRHAACSPLACRPESYSSLNTSSQNSWHEMTLGVILAYSKCYVSHTKAIHKGDEVISDGSAQLSSEVLTFYWSE